MTPTATGTAAGPVLATDVAVPASDGRGRPIPLPGRLTVPDAARGLVLFAHGSGSSRHSPRNTFVAAALQAAGQGTLLFDLLTDDEAERRSNVFDIPLLADRLAAAVAFVRSQEPLRRLPIGLFGASTGAAAALVTAADDPDIAAVVSRGGRPDLAGAVLGRVRAATLLIVGGDDTEVLALNRLALAALPGEKRLAVVPGATHLFEEPGTLEEAARLAADWFTRHMNGAKTS
jgi:putative phosphoribosyl transferase